MTNEVSGGRFRLPSCASECWMKWMRLMKSHCGCNLNHRGRRYPSQIQVNNGLGRIEMDSFDTTLKVL